MMIVDNDKKITVSLGGKCTLGCKHCYTNTRMFSQQPKIVPEVAVEKLLREKGKFSTICISGDTDTFLNPTEGITMLRQIIQEFTSETIMFTTRLIPYSAIIDDLVELGNICSSRKQLFIPCISIVTYGYPNEIENPNKVAPSIDRLDFLKHLATYGLPCFLTLRPTFPFSLVPLIEIEQILDYVGNAPIAVLGEVLLLDKADEIATRLNIQEHVQNCDEESKLTFISQPISWKKLYLSHEHQIIMETCQKRGLPYFMRSMSAVNYLKHINYFQDKWSHAPDFFNYEIGSIFP